MEIDTVGLGVTKNLLQVYGADAQEHVLLGRKLARSKGLKFFATLPACPVGLDASGSMPAHVLAQPNGLPGLVPTSPLLARVGLRRGRNVVAGRPLTVPIRRQP
jgi:hypothetical protein